MCPRKHSGRFLNEKSDSNLTFAGQGMQRKLADRPPSDFEQLLSPEDVAHVCGLSRRAVYRAIARGELRAARLCHRLRVRPEELERWIGAQTLAEECPAQPERSRPPRKAPSGGLRALLDQAGDG